MNEYGEWDSCSLTDDQIKKYSEMFETPIIVLEQMQATEIEVENTPDEETQSFESSCLLHLL